MARSDDDGTETRDIGESVDEAGHEDGVAAELDAAFDLLSAARRRHLLYFLSTRTDETATVEEAVEAVLAFADASDEDGELPARQSVRLSLIHSHIPRLDANDVVEYDARHGEIRVGTDEPLAELLERARRLELE